MDFQKICRLCCEEKPRMRSILGSDEQYSLAKIFSDILRLDVYADDGLPQQVCKVCIKNITKLQDTIEGYRANDLKMRNHLTGVVEIKEEEVDVDTMQNCMTQELKIEVLAEPPQFKDEGRRDEEGSYDSDREENHDDDDWIVHDDESEEESNESESSDDSTDRSEEDSYDSEYERPVKKKRRTPVKRRKSTPSSGKRRGRPKTKVDEHPNRPRKRDHKCYICNCEPLGSAEALVAHLNTHTDEVPYTCTICTMETVLITSVNTLNIHKRMHENPIKCYYCDRRYSSKHAVDLHVQLNHGEGNEACPSPCSYCGKICPTRLALRYHERTHRSAVSCEYCGKVYAEKHKLRLHIRRKHEKIREHECTLCHKKFSSLDSVHAHIKTMHSNTEFKCEYCNRSYTSELSLRYHVKKHEKDQNYQATSKWTQYYTFLEGEDSNKDSSARLKKCNLCGIVVQQIGTHLRNKHFPKEFRCGICDAVFKCKNRYDSHVLEHEFGKAYKCPICSKEFSDKKLLVSHLKTKQHRDHPLAQSLDWLHTRRVPKTVQRADREKQMLKSESLVEHQQEQQQQQQPLMPPPPHPVQVEHQVITVMPPIPPFLDHAKLTIEHAENH